MADTIKTVQYFKVKVPNRAGVGARMLESLRKANVNLLGFSGFPRGGRAQVDFAPANPATFRRAAKQAKIKVVGPQSCFIATGKDRPGAVAALMAKLAQKKINVTALDAVAAGSGRYGAIFWVKKRDYAKAKRALRIR